MIQPVIVVDIFRTYLSWKSSLSRYQSSLTPGLVEEDDLDPNTLSSTYSVLIIVVEKCSQQLLGTIKISYSKETPSEMTWKLKEVLFPALTWFLQELWQVLLPFMMTSKTPCLTSLWTNYGIKVMECFIFAETLYSFTKLLVKYPLRDWITKVSKLLPYLTTAQKLRTSWTSGVNYSYVGRHL